MGKLKIGIIGAESSHTLEIAKLINLEQKINGCVVDYVWGETSKFASEAASGGGIANIVTSPEDMIGKIDAVVITHRHCKYHIPAALPFVNAGVPIFIDKPFCYDIEEGLKFLEIDRYKKLFVLGKFSSIPP